MIVIITVGNLLLGMLFGPIHPTTSASGRMSQIWFTGDAGGAGASSSLLLSMMVMTTSFLHRSQRLDAAFIIIIAVVLTSD